MSKTTSIIIGMLGTILVVLVLELAGSLLLLEEGDLDGALTVQWIEAGYLISVALSALMYTMVERSTGSQMNYAWVAASFLGLIFIISQLPDASNEEYKMHRSEFEEYMKKRRASREETGEKDGS